jgi:hypothetical protein
MGDIVVAVIGIIGLAVLFLVIARLNDRGQRLRVIKDWWLWAAPGGCDINTSQSR